MMGLQRGVRFLVLTVFVIVGLSVYTQEMVGNKFKRTHISIFSGLAVVVDTMYVVKHRKVPHRQAEGAECIEG
jgi:hypothetical protein